MTALRDPSKLIPIIRILTDYRTGIILNFFNFIFSNFLKFIWTS